MQTRPHIDAHTPCSHTVYHGQVAEITQASVDAQRTKCAGSTHTVECHSATSDGAVTHTAARTDVENVRLGERTQAQRSTRRGIPFTGNVQSQQTHGDRTGVGLEWGGGSGVTAGVDRTC